MLRNSGSRAKDIWRLMGGRSARLWWALTNTIGLHAMAFSPFWNSFVSLVCFVVKHSISCEARLVASFCLCPP